VGQRPDGTPCSDSEICGPQSGCLTNVCNPTCQGGSGSAAGGPCSSSSGAYCQIGLTCDATRDVCVAPAPEGGPCGGLSALPCGPGLHCVAAADAGTTTGPAPTGTCVPRPGTGDPCSFDQDCASQNFCDHGACTQRLTLGAPCGDAQSGCGGFSTCDTSSASPTCVHAGYPGESCAPLSSVPAICLQGTVCDDTFTCVAPGQLGADCTAVTCASPLVCFGTCGQCPSLDAGTP
jgi:hypothetical protein